MSDNIIRKIKGLLAKAESSTFEGERESFMAKANELIVKHAIDLAVLAGNDTEDEIVSHHVINEGSYAQPWSFGYNHLCKAMGTTVYYTLGGRITSKHYGVIVGYRSDVDTIVMLHTSLALQATTAMRKYFKENGYESSNGSDRYRSRRDFLNNFFKTAAAKVEESMGQAIKDETDSHGTEVALRNRFDEAVAAAPNDLRSSTSRYAAGSAAAGRAGAAAGRRADIGQTRVSGGKKAIAR